VIDPVSAFATATAAYNAIKKGIELGQEIEGMASQLGKWFGACAEVKKAEEEASNPSLFKKLLHKGSVEQEALEALMRRKKIEEQENELRTMILYRYGQGAYREMIEERRKIETKRKRQEHLQSEKRKQAALNTLMVSAIIFCSYLIYVISDFILTHLKGNEL